jgi:hypothetical protein
MKNIKQYLVFGLVLLGIITAYKLTGVHADNGTNFGQKSMLSSTGLSFVFLVIELFFVCMIAIGLKTGTLPGMVFTSKKKYPFSFWLGIVIYFSAFCYELIRYLTH